MFNDACNRGSSSFLIFMIMIHSHTHAVSIPPIRFCPLNIAVFETIFLSDYTYVGLPSVMRNNVVICLNDDVTTFDISPFKIGVDTQFSSRLITI